MKITVLGKPKGKGRPRFYRGYAVTPKATREYEGMIMRQWQESALNGELEAFIDVFYPLDSKANKATKEKMIKNEIRPTKTPDIDNVIKIVLDALNGVAYEDDKQIIEVTGRKWFSKNPRVEIEIRRKQ